VPSLRTWWLIFYRRDRKEGTETSETKYYFELLLGLRLLIQSLLFLGNLLKICKAPSEPCKFAWRSTKEIIILLRLPSWKSLLKIAGSKIG
jgi:hypothetical protein